MKPVKIKGYYLCNFNPFSSDHIPTGVDKKIISQIKAFNEEKINCEFIYCPYAKTKLRRGLGSLPLVSDGVEWPNLEKVKGASFLYIRRPLYASREFNRFLINFKEENRDSLVIIELPSFPYDKEFSGKEMYFALRKDRKYRNKWKDSVDYIADLSGSSEIFNIKTLPIINGIDLDSTRVRKSSSKKTETINIIFSAFFGPWHGCDLLIKGLAKYYEQGGERDILLHLAGGGNMLQEIESIIREEHLEKHVKMYGPLQQDQLNTLFDECDFAVGSLGLHRRSANCRDSSLKTREYLAKGIPFVYAGTVDVFEKDPVDFCLQLPSVEKPTNFNAIVDFYDKLYSRESEDSLIQRIRSYAEQHISMKMAMASVIHAIKHE